MLSKIKKICGNKTLLLFLFFFALYFVINVFFVLSTNSNVFDFVFQSDSPRVMEDMIQIFGNHYRFYVHPLFVVLIQPLVLLLNGIIHNNLLTIVIFQSIIGGLQVALLYNILKIYDDNEKKNVIVSALFGFAFSTIVFNTTIELYNIASLGLLGLWYTVSIMLKNKKYDKKLIDFLFIICGVFCIGITITNYVVVLIASFILLLFKKQSLLNLFIKNIVIIIITIVLLCVEIICWNIPVNGGALKTETTAGWVDKSININKIKNVVSDDLYNSVLASNVTTKTQGEAHILTFEKTKATNIIVMTSLYLLILFLIIKNFKKNIPMNIALLLTLMFNCSFHLIYGNNDCFLYSNHFAYLIFLLIGLNGNFNNKKANNALNLVMIVLLLLIAVNNLIQYKTIIHIAGSIFSFTNFGKMYSIYKLVFSLGTIIILLAEVLFFIWSIRKKNIINYIVAFSSILMLSAYFVFVDVSLSTRTFESLSPNKIESYEKKLKKFDNHFINEINKYYEYVNEFNEITNDYNNELVYFDGNFYLYGFNNREKILYKDGELVDIFSNEVIAKYDVKEQLIIPNIFTVIIRTKNDEYIKIHENEDGVFINDEVIKNTNKQIKLYSFNDEKYKNILNTLYGEILFNIKDGIIYPNILVYDHPWYRDAALGAMVLEYTKNTDLIKDWVNSITEIYDKQNGNDEPDNLGELLYLLSLNNGNKQLQKKVIREAEKLAKTNKDGFYIYGIVDGSRMDTYSNRWLEFGYKKIGLKYNFDRIENKDGYTDMMWFYDNCNDIRDSYSYSKDYPYLTWASNHCNKDLTVFFNHGLYPLSWESNASKANYNKINNRLGFYIDNKTSPTHVWAASEMFLNILEGRVNG